jgi:hypothetical protein
VIKCANTECVLWQNEARFNNCKKWRAMLGQDCGFISTEQLKVITGGHKMMFTEHTDEELWKILEWLRNTPLPIECFDAFLAEYGRTKNIATARFFALSEWDC